MRAIVLGIAFLLGAGCGPDLQPELQLETSQHDLKRRRPTPDAGKVDAGSVLDAGRIDAGQPTVDAGPPVYTDVERHNLLVAYDIRVDVGQSYLTALPATSFSPLPTSSSRVVTLDGTFYFHAYTLYWDFSINGWKTREIWASPTLNQYFVQNNGVRGPVALDGSYSGAGRFLPDNFTIEKLISFSLTAEAL